MGMGFPETACHSERVTASVVQADDSYRDVLAVESVPKPPGAAFLLPRNSMGKGNKQCFT
jgi:hypothetical protein